MDAFLYQLEARKYKIYPNESKIIYPVLGLVGEAGETANLIKKVIRDSSGNFNNPEFISKLKDELGDVLWYLAAICEDLNLNLSDIAARNLNKLEDRYVRKTLGGSGDDR
ncbi:MAG TPA: nucleoside triphosphate pyrophosphohydrolase family protein [Thermodesulfobacteriota bacterium]|nr:nucleoside triphosphate pyrophosphohydrolase family protein [Thermodesulfobacteriota bacterium]